MVTVFSTEVAEARASPLPFSSLALGSHGWLSRSTVTVCFCSWAVTPCSVLVKSDLPPRRLVQDQLVLFEVVVKLLLPKVSLFLESFVAALFGKSDVVVCHDRLPGDLGLRLPKEHPRVGHPLIGAWLTSHVPTRGLVSGVAIAAAVQAVQDRVVRRRRHEPLVQVGGGQQGGLRCTGCA